MKNILVTGATDGIGRQTAFELARAGHSLVIHGRNADKLRATRQDLVSRTDNQAITTAQGDFASLEDVRELAETLNARQEHFDVLLNNAGVYLNEYRKSADGFEATFAINHLAPFLLTHLLLDHLRDGVETRIVNVSSIAHSRAQLDFDNLNAEKGFSPYGSYALSKLANVLFTVELARRLPEGANTTVNALHPGVVSTKLLTEGFGMSGNDSLDEGAATSVMLATADAVSGVTGRYFSAQREANMNPIAKNLELTSRFYELSCELVGIDGLPRR